MKHQYVTVSTLDQLRPGMCQSVELTQVGLALFNIDGKIYALDNTCPHAGGPIGEGSLDGDIVTCPWHGWKFNVRTGLRLKNPSEAWKIQQYQVRIVDETIQVLVPKA